MTDDALESRLLRFEEAWRRHGPCEVADFLDEPPLSSSVGRRRLLVEVIAIDLEYRWRNGDPQQRVMLENYAARFPELVSLDRLPIELIGEEYRVRQRWGDRPSHAEFLSRFDSRREEIRAELLRVDGELAEEADLSPATRPEGRACSTPDPADPVPVAPLLSHRDFLLRRLIGVGRMGKVYQARQHSTGREVAVKFLRKTLVRERLVVRRFLDEASIVAGLRHPQIVGTQGLGRTSGGSYFIVMDLVCGPDLAQVGRSRPIAVAEAIRWAIEACGALEYAHERGVIHCDLKPANLLLDASGGIRVADFGLARSFTGETPWTAEVEGTAPFMAPEQVSRCWGRIDQRTDVYGIGAVLFTLLTGRPPHVGRRLPDVLADVIRAAPVESPAGLRPGLPGPISDVCRRCLSKAPEGRYARVRDLHAALAAVIGRPL